MGRLRTILLLSVAWPMAVAAQDFDLSDSPATPVKPPPPAYASVIEAGLGYQGTGSFYLGRYGGRVDKGLFGFFDATVSRRPAWDSGKSTFWGGHLNYNGQQIRNADGFYGVQGKWRVGAFYDAFTRYISDSARSPFLGVGTGRLTLPADWQTSVSSLLFRSLPGAALPVDLKVKWQTVGGDYVMTPREGYEVRLHFDHRHRAGLKDQYITFGQEMLSPVGIFFPQTIDYDSNHAVVSLGFADKKVQWRASYEFSAFHNALPSMLVPNPYNRSIGFPWPAGAFAGYPFAVGQYSLPPDNTAHQAQVTGGIALTPTMRLTAKLAYTVQRQDEPFLPYTTNPNIDVRTPLPRTSANAEIRRTYGNLMLTARQGKSIDLVASYTYDDRDNRTPRSLYSYVANDVQDQQQPIVFGGSRYIRYNLPHSFTFHQAKAELGYRLTPRTRLSVAYTGDFRTRTYQEVSKTDEQTVRAKAQTTFAKGSLWIAQTFANRTGSDYLDYVAWNASHTDQYLAVGPQNQSIEYGLLRMYHLADRRRHETKGGATYDLAAGLTASVSGGFARDNYSRSLFGLLRSDTLLADGDITYVLQKSLTASAFYSFERIRSVQKGYFLFNANETNPAQAWVSASRDTIHSAGVRLDWQARPNLKLGGNYTLSRGRTNIITESTAFTPLAASTPLPDALANTHTAGVRGEYAVRENLSLRAGYTFEHHVTDDWRYLNSLTPVSQILGSGEIAPRYNAHVVWVSARTQF